MAWGTYVTTYKEADKLLGKLNELHVNNDTWLERDPNPGMVVIHVVLCDQHLPIVTYQPSPQGKDWTIYILDNCGRYDAFTLQRINAYTPDAVTVYIQGKRWNVKVKAGTKSWEDLSRPMRFKNGIMFSIADEG